MQKKVTLSFDDKIYEKFEKFCKDNAIMLSKKIELCMDDIMKKGGKKDEKSRIFACLLINVLHSLFLLCLFVFVPKISRILGETGLI